jgi:hypothetical protein
MIFFFEHDRAFETSLAAALIRPLCPLIAQAQEGQRFQPLLTQTKTVKETAYKNSRTL